MALRRKTAASLFAKIKNPSDVSAENVKALAEIVSYVNEGRYAESFKKCLEAYRMKADKPADEVKSVNEALKVLVRNRIVETELVK